MKHSDTSFLHNVTQHHKSTVSQHNSECHEIEPGETWVAYWKKQNKLDKAIGLYCQSCCYRYPDECLFMDTLHPYDRAAEACPDYIPKDYYKPKHKAKCLLLRLEVDTDYSPLPECDQPHPLKSPFIWCDNVTYYKIVTKQKAIKETS